MAQQTRPRWDEFFLAVLWTLGSGVWGTFGVFGYISNLTEPNGFKLAGFIISFFLLCLTVFGLRFALNVYLRIPRNLPAWFDNAAPITLGVTLLLGLFFSLFTAVLVLLNIFREVTNNLIFTWGFATAVGIVALATYQFFAALNAFEPFINWEEREGRKSTPFFRLLVRLNSFQRSLHASNFGPKWNLDKLHGPLLPETDLKTVMVEEKAGGRPGLERTMSGHGGFHVTTLGFTANGSVVFACSDGGMLHFQAGGRKGTIFPPEIKFWDWHNNRVQTATLGAPRTFLTTNHQAPPTLQNFRFIVPPGGGRFAWVTPKLIQVGDWNNDQLQKLEPDDGLMLKGFNGFIPLAFNPDGTKLAWCDVSGQTRYWDLDGDRVQPLRVYPTTNPNSVTGTEEGAWGLVFSPDGTKVATLGIRGVLLQNVYTGWRWFAENNPTHEKLTAFAFNHNGFEMAVGLSVRPEAVKPLTRRNRNNSGTGSLGFNSNGAKSGSQNDFQIITTRMLAYSPEDSAETDKWSQVVRLWDLRAADYHDLVAGESSLREIAFSPDNRMLVAVDESGHLRLWDIAPEGSVGRLPRLVALLDLGLTGRKIVLAFSPDLERLITATDNRILIWNLARVRQECKV
ncbi:MAG: WD40 repeat domain-containing protein [Chloroflexota bacterium]|nr:WD40 repeat domain-containing protein [Chloroflexota bacterium]